MCSRRTTYHITDNGVGVERHRKQAGRTNSNTWAKDVFWRFIPRCCHYNGCLSICSSENSSRVGSCVSKGRRPSVLLNTERESMIPIQSLLSVQARMGGFIESTKEASCLWTETTRISLPITTNGSKTTSRSREIQEPDMSRVWGTVNPPRGERTASDQEWPGRLGTE